MRLNYLESFVALCETLSFSKAALRLGVTQPAVSRQIRLLEEQLGHRLFVRDRNQVHLSREGQRLKLTLLPLMSDLQATLDGSRGGATELKGPIHFGSLTEVGQSVFMKVLLKFQSQHPGVSVRVEYLKEFEIFDKVKTGSLSFGVVTQARDVESVRSYPIIKETILLVTRANNHKNPQDYDEIPMVSYREDDPLLLSFKKHRSISKQARVAVSVNSHQSMKDALLATESFAVMPHQSVQDLIRQKKLRAVPGFEQSHLLYLIHLENSHMTHRNVVFKQFFMSEVRKG